MQRADRSQHTAERMQFWSKSVSKRRQTVDCSQRVENGPDPATIKPANSQEHGEGDAERPRIKRWTEARTGPSRKTLERAKRRESRKESVGRERGGVKPWREWIDERMRQRESLRKARRGTVHRATDLATHTPSAGHRPTKRACAQRLEIWPLISLGQINVTRLGRRLCG
jgi:hypothetical protein